MEQTNETTAAVPVTAAQPGPDLAAEREGLINERARLVAEGQIREISQLDGQIATMDDLLDMPEFDRFYALVKKGVNLVEAYKLIRYDTLMERAAEAASRQAMHSMATRGHLTAAAAQPGNGDYVTVPAEVAAGFRQAKPGISDSEIKRRYRQYQKYRRQ